MTDQEKWLNVGLEAGWVKPFCLLHDSGMFESEYKLLEDGDDPCFGALRIVPEGNTEHLS
jgi:hypothetical protein